ncbi:hypothetical protein FisN_29Lh035 [Fistulifera solaris]|uniref:Uncharacterized protein n=1 Tax=Fistulifera solaris TaxID=1519565 RepID=A0A1Z5JLH2_FISSO|nr:hypothetical protein FisN_29Lh035 [Fistulifera solaris]|eukprot:GAX14829.1 hypothetical protein FisN_29Lh035 [Fistulifera solaris]
MNAPFVEPHPLRRLGSSFNIESSSFPLLLAFYQAPRQRHRWQEPQQHLTHKQWGDIFFDLFYVAAAYNLGIVLQQDPTTTEILYFLGYFLPLQSLWMLQLLRDGRFLFATGTFYESVLSTLRFVTVACAVLHIRPSPSSMDLFWFCVAIAMGLLWHGISCLEIMYCQRYCPQNQLKTNEKEVEQEIVEEEEEVDPKEEEDEIDPPLSHQRVVGLEPAAWDTAVTTLHIIGVPFGLVVAAVIYAGRQKFTNIRRRLESNEEEEEEEEEDPVVMYLLLASSLWIILYHAVRQFINDFIFQRDHKRSVVPINVEYAIHRYGEWIMLMLGETVLSLLIVDPVHHADYYITFFAGVLSIIMVEYLHFLSQPHDPDHHALRRNIYGAILHTTTMMFYSASLIVLGASYKMLLYELVYEHNDRHGEYHQNTRSVLGTVFFQRTLAGATSDALDTEDRQKRIAILFSGSMAIVWICLDILILAHHGWKDLWATWKVSSSPALVGMAQMGRWSILIWFLSLPQYVTEPKMLSLLGVIGLLGQIVIQMIIYSLCPKNPAHKEEEEINRVLEYANARLRVIKSNGA